MSITVAYAAATGMPTHPTNGEPQQLDRAASHHTWLADYLERLDGKEARREYYARLE